MKKYIYIAVLVIFVTSAMLVGCNNNKKVNEDNKTPVIKSEVDLKIMTTNKFLYYMVKDIVKDKHFVNYMFKNETDQWNFVFSKDSLENISNQDLFIYVGAGFEPWIGNFLDGLNKNSVGVINASRGVKLIDYDTEVKYNNTILTDNPYYWLDINNYKAMMLNIKNVIEEKDPQNRDFYEENFAKAKEDVDNFGKQLKDISSKAKDCVFLVEGDKLDYFLDYNNLKYLKLDKYYTLTPDKKNEKADFEKKLKDAKKLILLCQDDSDKRINEVLINEYNIKIANIIAYKEGYSFQQILKYDIDNLNNTLSK